MKQTRKAIQDAYIALCEKKPADKITVKEIVEICGINRNSFYYHFEDLPSLTVSIMEDQIRQAMYAPEVESLQEGFLRCAQCFQDNIAFYRNVYYSKNREVLDYQIRCLIDEMLGRLLNHSLFVHYDISEEDQEIITSVYCMEMLGLLFGWLQEGMKYDLPTRYRRVFELRRGTAEMMARRADRSGRCAH